MVVDHQLETVGISTEYPTHVSLVDRERRRFVTKFFYGQCSSLLSFGDDFGTDGLPATFPRIEANSAAVKGAGNLSSPIVKIGSLYFSGPPSTPRRKKKLRCPCPKYFIGLKVAEELRGFGC